MSSRTDHRSTLDAEPATRSGPGRRPPWIAECSRRGKKWYRKGLVLAGRVGMFFSRLLRDENRPRAAVAATKFFPIDSHTFVYQEMVGLRDMGMDVDLLCWSRRDTSRLPAAFRYLADHCHVLQPIPEYHAADVRHFHATRPGRLEAFLERLSGETGRSTAELAVEPLVLEGCSFARCVERLGADYIHTYFFYDQSLMGMLAAWLLQLPRGITCYADHMLDDFPLKLVALHVETADLIVATSHRIREEVLEKTGGRWADKVLVKPNGVDGARFPLQDPVAFDGAAFELASVCRVEPKKGLLDLVDAVAVLRDRGREVLVHSIGDVDPLGEGSVEYGRALEERIEELGLRERFIVHGSKRQAEIPPILARCHAFVAPYVETASGDKDGIPTAMLEAMASGLPVITTDAGSIPEVVDDGVEGLVCRQHAPEELADAIARMAADDGARRGMAQRARARFEAEFDTRVTERTLHARVRELLVRV